MRSSFVLLGAALFACSSTSTLDERSDGTPGKCAIACGYTATLLYPYSDTYAALRASTFRLCRNADCVEGSFSSLPSDPPAPESGISPPQDPGVSVTVWNRAGALVLEADFRIDDSRTLVEGDIYSLTVTSDSGRALIVERNAHYETYTNCGGSCQRAAFDPAQPECCPRDEAAPANELFMGGSAKYGCFETYDFWCTQNFRIETGLDGCESWAYENIPNCAPPGFPDGGG